MICTTSYGFVCIELVLGFPSSMNNYYTLHGQIGSGMTLATALQLKHDIFVFGGMGIDFAAWSGIVEGH